MKLSYVVPAIAFVIAGWHFTALRHPPNTPWKGGGFGMYTEPPLFFREVWIGERNADKLTYKQYRKTNSKFLKPLRKAFFKQRSFPSKRAERKLLDKMEEVGMVSSQARDKQFIAVTELRLDQANGVLKQRVLYNGAER